MITSELALKIRKCIELEGPIPFDRYMEMCLYDPDWGYYTRSADIIGRKGDYYTSSDIHPIFGWTIANYFKKIMEKENFHTIVEIGPGKGFLALDILSFMEKNFKNFGELRYILIEKSPAMRNEIKRNLSDYLNSVKIMSSLEELKSFEGIVFSNELFDALPHKRFILRDEGWMELYVGFNKSGFKEIERKVKDEELLRILERYAPFVHSGNVVEFSIETFSIIEKLSLKHKGGKFLTIDYGDKRKELIERFPKGSLIGYRRHQIVEDPYKFPGEQDLTCHVDFTLLEEILTENGYKTEFYKDQGGFLIDAGIIEILKEIEKNTPSLLTIKARLSFKKLVLDFGRNYRVLSAIKT